MEFLVKSIALDSRLHPNSGIISAEDIQCLTDAQSLAQKILEEANLEAMRVKEQAQTLAENTIKEAEASAFEKATKLLTEIQVQRQAFLDGSESLLFLIVNAIIDKLMLEITDAQKISACVARIKNEAPRDLINAHLHVNPQDIPYIPNTNWKIVADPLTPIGSCRLEAEGGVWNMDFTLAVESMKLALPGMEENQQQ